MDTQAERPRPENTLKFSLDGWRPIFFFAIRNWYDRQDMDMRKLLTLTLNQIATDQTQPPSRQAKAADLVFARGALGILRDQNLQWFPNTKSFTADQLGDDVILFLVTNFPPDYHLKSRFQDLAKKRKLRFQASFEQPEPRLPRPAFISTIIKEVQSSVVA